MPCRFFATGNSELLHQPVVVSVVVGARNPEQVKQNAGAAELRLSEETITELNEATRKVKEILGANANMWQTESETRIK